MSNATTVDQIVCECTHLTVFAAGLIVPPNSLDFDFIFQHASIDQNITIYVTIVVLFILYLSFIVWAHRKDKEDEKYISCVPLLDNGPGDKYIYEVIVRTGMRKGASCDSQVYIFLGGSEGTTEERKLNNGLDGRRILRRGKTDRFVMTTARYSDLLHISI